MHKTGGDFIKRPMVFAALGLLLFTGITAYDDCCRQNISALGAACYDGSSFGNC